MADSIISSTLQISVTSNVCLCCNNQEEKFAVITLPLTFSVPESIKKFLEPQQLIGKNRQKRWFCPSCNNLTNSKKKIKFIKVIDLEIFQLKHYIMFKGNRINRKVKRSSDLLKSLFLVKILFLFQIHFLSKQQ